MCPGELISQWLPAIAVVFPTDARIESRTLGESIIFRVVWRQSPQDVDRVIDLSVSKIRQDQYSGLSEYDQEYWIEQMQEYIREMVFRRGLISDANFAH
jgi:hypothetical protein